MYNCITLTHLVSIVSTWTLCVNYSFLATEKELFSVEKQEEKEEQQKIITSLTLQLRERDEQIEELNQSLKGKYYRIDILTGVTKSKQVRMWSVYISCIFDLTWFSYNCNKIKY